jgi:hypothetical protein
MANLAGTASIEIDAPLAAVWRTVEDVLAAPEWQEGLLAMEALERDAEGRPTLVDSESDAKVRRLKIRLRFSYEAPHKLSWTQEHGDLKSLAGWWQLEQLADERTRATYGIDADPGGMLGMLIRGPVEGAIRAVLVNGRPGELKARVEGGAGAREV